MVEGWGGNGLLAGMLLGKEISDGSVTRCGLGVGGEL